ncbi:MAG: glycine betaine/L-proline ABC transporter substrate-binding protein ProX [Paracoccus sp. (in: a-proteobacteria)]|nr:glycine betaine/L-proline ABC transporter substrate-binding protein ProX [Paracoccus sp. (in: a-proteobacteria)]
MKIMRTKAALTLGTAMWVGLATVTGATAQTQPGNGTRIVMAQPTWDTGWFQTEIYAQMLQELGYDLEPTITLDNPIFYQSVAYGDVTMWVDGWFPLHNAYRDSFDGRAEIVGAVARGGALEGYLVDRASAEEFGITSLDDFKRPEVQAAFDRNGNGLADLVACPPGWACEVNIDHHLDAYGLREHVSPIKAGYSASMADAVAAYGAGEPIFFYTWTPNWTVNELVPGEDVVWIEVPEVSLPEEFMYLADAATIPGVEGCVNDPCVLGFPASDIVPVVNTEFLDANPAVRTLLEEASIPLSDIVAQNAAMNAGDTDLKAQAASWIEANRADVDAWLDAARAAADQ